MLRYLFNKALIKFSKRYHYDVAYMQFLLRGSLSGFIKFSLFQAMSAHNHGVPAGPYFTAKIRTALWDDCGPCSQLTVDMALEAGVPADQVSAIVANDIARLSEHNALALRFTEKVLSHDPEADAIRDQIHALWGDHGLITLGFVISSCRVYPALKYSLGYGRSCTRININNKPIIPLTAEAN